MRNDLRVAPSVIVLACLAAASAAQQDYRPPPGKEPEPAALKEIEDRTRKLRGAVRDLRRLNVPDAFLVDIEVYLKAAEWIVRHREFFPEGVVGWTLEGLDRGLLRASQAGRGEFPWLGERGRAVARGYRSRVDGSVQPYAVTYPVDYGTIPAKRYRLDVVLHGRDSTLTEVKFLHQNDGVKDAPKDQDFVQLTVYGRGNVAYRWAGETDVFEAIETFLAIERQAGRDLIDPLRVVLRGFSMGGAGTWHLGLHHPDRWCVLGPGAGFTATKGYAKVPDRLPDFQEACLHIYDAVDYAENVANVPVVAYSGELDPQIQAARNVEDRLKEFGVAGMKHLVAPGLKHQFPPEWQRKADAEYRVHADLGKGRNPFPERVRFVTWTLKYPSCNWVELLGLERHYAKAAIDAIRLDRTFKVQTTNVRTFRIVLPGNAAVFPESVTIDGQEVASAIFTRALAAQGCFERRDGKWRAVLPQKLMADRLRRPQKVARLQGPIDDAFTEPFLCVTGAGQPWHDGSSRSAAAQLERFTNEWNKYLRGDLPTKSEAEINDEDLASRHLVLFGDPASNGLIAQVLDGLPLKWTKDSIEFDGRVYDASTHLPMLIFPNPLNPNRYVVLNSGHTFHAPDFQGTNALLFPRLGDYAIVKLTPTEKEPTAFELVGAGLFDDFWRLPARKK